MPKQPRVTAAEAIIAFQRAGFAISRTSASHVILKRPGHRFHLSVPFHKGKVLGNGLLSSLISAAGLTVSQFAELLK